MKLLATVLMVFLFAALGNAYAQAPALPTLPQKTVSLHPAYAGYLHLPDPYDRLKLHTQRRKVRKLNHRC